MNAMKPILFNTDMVRAILDGHKTVTRRVVKPQPRGIYHDGKFYEEDSDLFVLAEDQNGKFFQSVPPYRPGDILYVRETWGLYHQEPGFYVYKADKHAGTEFDGFKWRPSIHIPREAARIFLRVTDVLVQQIKDITDADALLEGFYSRASLVAELLKIYPKLTENSWVWVIGFKRCERPKGG